VNAADGGSLIGGETQRAANDDLASSVDHVENARDGGREIAAGLSQRDTSVGRAALCDQRVNASDGGSLIGCETQRAASDDLAPSVVHVENAREGGREIAAGFSQREASAGRAAERDQMVKALDGGVVDCVISVLGGSLFPNDATACGIDQRVNPRKSSMINSPFSLNRWLRDCAGLPDCLEVQIVNALEPRGWEED